jgi:hypothetical protein
MSQLPKIAAVKSLLIARTIPAQLTLSMWPRFPGRPRVPDEVGIGVAFVVGTVVLDRHGPHIPMMEFRR